MDQNELSDDLRTFEGEVWALRRATMNIRRWLAAVDGSQVEQVNEYLHTHGTPVPDSESGSYRFEHPAHAVEFDKKQKNLESIQSAERLAPQALFISLFARFEALAGATIRYVAAHKTELFLDAKAAYSLAQISEHPTLEAFRTALVEARVDEVARKSPYELLKFFRAGLSADYQLDQLNRLWPRFVEASERRNCHAHNNGLVSSQYLRHTQQVGYRHDEPLEVGDHLPLDGPYIDSTALVVLEVGILVCIVTWRAVDSSPGTQEQIAQLLTDSTLHAINAKQYDFAERLCTFAKNAMSDDISQGHRLIIDVNLAQIYKWRGDDDRKEAALAAIDWSAASERFLLARDVLTDDFAAAAGRMPRCCGEAQDLLPPHALLSWPLFKEFRESTEFVDAFESVFGITPHARTGVSEAQSGSPEQPAETSAVSQGGGDP